MSGDAVRVPAGGEAVGFTASLPAAPFGAGVVHAWIASDRRPPSVVAGVSTGALTAAVFQAALACGRPEERRAVLREYLDLLAEGPLPALLESLPDRADFRGAPPVADPATPPPLRPAEEEALGRRRALAALLAWLARLPVPISAFAAAAAAFVRWRERPPGALPPGRLLGLLLRAGPLLTRLAAHVALRAPLASPRPGGGRGPLLGAGVHLAASGLFAGAASAILSSGLLLLRFAGPLLSIPEPDPLGLLWTETLVAGLAGGALLWAGCAAAFLFPSSRAALASRAARALGISRSLLSPFPVERRLRDLLARGNDEPAVSEAPMPLLVVAAPLQTVLRQREGGGDGKPLAAYQLWARPGAPLLTALRAALATPGLFPPVRVTAEEAQRGWLSPRARLPEGAEGLDLVDGSVVRQNPLPALFAFLKSRPDLAARLAAQNGPARPALLVVHGVPITTAEAGLTPLPADRRGLVDQGLSALRLARRRDTQLEVEQTNFISRLERVVPHGPKAPTSPTFALFAAEVAPEADLPFANPFAPRRDEVLSAAAAGCRRTLALLHAAPLRRATGQGPVRCAVFLRTSGERRDLAEGQPPGLPEVCGACTGLLPRPAGEGNPVRSTPRPALDLRAPRAPDPRPAEREPRLVVVASGGVFRGAFHAGLLGALSAGGVRPDLVAGASVGTLVGGALATLSSLPAGARGPFLAEMVDLFARAGERVALTGRLRRALADLAARAASVRLSPASVRRRLRSGTRADAGYAALGAPPVLVDAVSTLLLLPHRETAAIAEEIVAGRVAEAVRRLLAALERHTLPRLGLADALLGASLLEPSIRRLLAPPGSGIDLGERQPWARHGTFLLATAVDLGSGAPVLLGDGSLHPGRPWDAAEAFLASSAFPCVFAPRRESDVFPGTGDPDVLLADGGMFDNLPFVPALRALAQAQRAARAAGEVVRPPSEELRARFEAPDLLLAAALDANPEASLGAAGPFDGLGAILARARSLEHNVKVRSVEWAQEKVHGQVGRLLSSAAVPLPAEQEAVLDGVVDAAVLPVFPAGPGHLNPTFAFARTLGLAEARVARSVGDGCFQTLAALLGANGEERTLRGLSVARLVSAGRLPRLSRRAPSPPAPAGECPHFLMARAGGASHAPPAPFACPFHASGGAAAGLVRRACAADPAHLSAGEV